jgi:hypothetical protein
VKTSPWWNSIKMEDKLCVQYSKESKTKEYLDLDARDTLSFSFTKYSIHLEEALPITGNPGRIKDGRDYIFKDHFLGE